ncbi:HET-domain-containing protein [Annulohypoxylon maeteangense]|uniref:HET-domain-containing protein n=1 Tax=Annulohypoxylon maeteangense TaxID=1927788 RepID=UPI0020074C85|nr:HET-domain-containing protein [Annulohypoxylon maeteangense]KAI0880001.1 HET-domain-containing protein [Annulohypoxylon maeteangense]
MNSCTVCRNLEALPGLSGGFITGGIGNDLQRSAPTCQLCSILWEGLEAFCLDSPGTVQWMALLQAEDSFRLNYKYKESPVEKEWIGLHFYTKSLRDPLSRIFIPSNGLEPDTSSKKYIAQMKGWVDSCDNGHDICQRNLTNTYLPTRVLDVSREQYKIFLQEPENGDRGPYIALSHCWGGVVPTITTKKTLQNFKNGVSIESFPKTFQDAMFITRQLQCRYLWIDSVCIIQDSAEDWRDEASRMADVYGNAYVTILATASLNSHGGLFHQHDPLDARHTVKRTGEDGEAVVVEVRPALEHAPYFASSPFGLESSVQAPLLERSWCFQEYLLAPRVLSFTQWEMLWLCLTKRLCNCGEYNENTRDIVAASDLKARFDEQLRGTSSPDKLYLLWQDIIEAYLRKGLTYDGDRLPALAGIAQLFFKKGLGRYLNGLWEPNLIPGLFWSLDWRFGEYNGIVTKRSTDQTMPSWSWASVSGSFHYPLSPSVSKGIEVLNISYKSVISNPLAEICADIITISGVLTQVHLWGEEGNTDYHRRWYRVSGLQEMQRHDCHIDVESEVSCSADDPMDAYILSGKTGPALILHRVEGTASSYRRLGMLGSFRPRSELFHTQTIQLV